MRKFNCSCGNTVFFENNQCVACGSELGWCPRCLSLRSLAVIAEGQYRCTDVNCGAILVKCHNYHTEEACNRCLIVESENTQPLCDYCCFNHTIPDLSVEGNREKWLRLEQGKRRLLYTLDMLDLPYGNDNDIEPKLSFDFKGDVITERKWWWTMGKEERVYTGHAGGKITINIREADDLEREKSRVSFKEAHRTVIGHFRHEIGHYYWDLLVKNKCEPTCVEIFGDHNNPSYSDALQHYYNEGPPPNWQHRFVSSYATMHPWEDFAECFATYLDMVSVLDTALHMGFIDNLNVRDADFKIMAEQYARLGVMLNEMNRAMGLLDLVPEILAPAILHKIEFVHGLVRQAAAR